MIETVRSPARGLTGTEVADRVRRGLTNSGDEPAGRSLLQILRANLLTRFNALLGTLLAVVLLTGSWQDATFGLVLVVNSLVGVVQEVRAKRTLDRLAVLTAPLARVRRDGAVGEVPVPEVVLDDVLELRAGDQVPADAEVLAGAGLEVDESLLTGESDPVPAPAGTLLLSGAVVVAGRGQARVVRVGAEGYARRLAAQARRFSLIRSELLAGINRLLGYLSWVLIVVGPILLVSQLRSQSDPRQAVIAAAAGLVGMVPEGLVLLTTLAFLVAVLTLARRQVLVQELPAVEVLARVDTICLDKTGTLTEGRLVLSRCEPVAEPGDPRLAVLAEAVGALADDPAGNATLRALARAYPPPEGWQRRAEVAFSSSRKWSAVTFAGHGTWLLGAPEILLARLPADDPVRQRAQRTAAAGHRVLALAASDRELPAGAAPGDPAVPTAGERSDPDVPAGGEPGEPDVPTASVPGEADVPAGSLRDEPAVPAADPIALLVLDEQVRPDAARTLQFFAGQGVTVKVLSGDNPATIGAVAGLVGLPGADSPVDARQLPDDPAALADRVQAGAVFGRVTPEQKRAMVRALQSRGHVVAMTGDGVNDVLAIKDADLGVAMGSGAAATRAVARVVLVDNRFDRLPAVLAEGRRVIANIERVAGLFVIKNVYSALLSVAVAIAAVPFPFLPRQLTVISTLTIGLPAFVLALAPNQARYRAGFLRRVLRFSLPAGLLIGIGVFAAYATARWFGLTTAQSRTAAGVTVMLAGLWVLVLLARPVSAAKTGLIAAMGGCYALALALPPVRDFLALAIPPRGLGTAALIGGGVAVAVTAAARIAQRRG